ncbi:ferrous iron transporter B [Flavobacterium sediminis]|nr:hypothetical protein [Flavobacterium sediminis]
MIFGTPISWFLVEIFSLVLFFMCMNHAIKQERPFLRLLELFGFVLGAGIFENIGVNSAHAYYYDIRRIMMIADVPLEILLLEASIWYAAFNLAIKLNLPKWGIPFIVGLFGSIQDMTIDPAAVFDSYALQDTVANTVNLKYPGAFIDGYLSGQWNWTNPGYENSFFGIPIYNFSGWMYLMFFYTVWILIGRWLQEKFDSIVVGYFYPFIAGVLNVACLGFPLTVFLVFGTFDSNQSTFQSELIILCINFAFAISLLVFYRKRLTKIDIRKDGVILFLLPVIMHLYDVFYAFIQKVEIAYIPVLIVSLLHFAYLFYVYQKSKNMTSIVY